MASVEMEKNVVIIDSSNEIAGDGTQTHESVGFARRMMLSPHKAQHDIMIECVQVRSQALCLGALELCKIV